MPDTLIAGVISVSLIIESVEILETNGREKENVPCVASSLPQGRIYRVEINKSESERDNFPRKYLTIFHRDYISLGKRRESRRDAIALYQPFALHRGGTPKNYYLHTSKEVSPRVPAVQ